MTVGNSSQAQRARATAQGDGAGPVVRPVVAAAAIGGAVRAGECGVEVEGADPRGQLDEGGGAGPLTSTVFSRSASALLRADPVCLSSAASRASRVRSTPASPCSSVRLDAVEQLRNPTSREAVRQ
ncbi:hypothetical protein UK12_07470 [Saccharothrix sp. ST-888]|nr:hypothetical protein UK12_07470 [Saccharothrix sp. ST-888]